MKKLQFLTTFILLIIAFNASSQKNYDQLDFTTVDNFAKTVKYRNDIARLTQELVQPYKEDIYKVRSIFIWITDNIEYDYKLYNDPKPLKSYKCGGTIDCETAKAEWENDYLQDVLRKKKGICSGYARLFKKLCNLANITCEVVPGYTKTRTYQIGIPLSVSHAWNAVLIDSSYHFLDATWAAGKCPEDEETGKPNDFIKEFNNYYWLTPFDKLIRNHFPENSKWLLQKNFTKEGFTNAPYYAGNILSKIDVTTPTTGILNAKRGDTIHFQFSYTDKISFIQVNSNVYRNPKLPVFRTPSNELKIITNDSLLVKRARFIPFQQFGNTYRFDYVLTNPSQDIIEVLFDFRTVLKYKINML